MSRPTISTPRRSAGLSSICKSTRARSSPSRMTVIFSTTLPDGYLSLIAGKEFRIREITRRGLSRKERGSHRKPVARTSCKRRSNASLNGSACRQKAVTLSQKPASTTMKTSSRPNQKSTLTISRSTFRPAKGLATSSSKPTAFQKVTATRSYSKTSNFRCQKAVSSASSARTVLVKRRCFV